MRTDGDLRDVNIHLWKKESANCAIREWNRKDNMFATILFICKYQLHGISMDIVMYRVFIVVFLLFIFSR